VRQAHRFDEPPHEDPLWQIGLTLVLILVALYLVYLMLWAAFPALGS
jgi:hypothetical protein